MSPDTQAIRVGAETEDPMDPMETTEVEAPVEVVAATDEAAPEALVEDDLLVEDVSIDGMCGVY